MNANSHAFPLSYRWLCLWLVSLFAAGSLSASVSGSVTYDGKQSNGSPVINATFNWSNSTVIHTDGRFKTTVIWSINWSKNATYTNSNLGLSFQLGAPGNNGISGDFPSSLTCAAGQSVGSFSGTGIIYFSSSTPMPQAGTSSPTATLCVAGSVVAITYPAVGLNPQTVSISPSSATVRVNTSVSLTGSGAHNGYDWTATSGGFFVSQGASATFQSPTAATYIIQLSSGSGNGYSASNVATATITVTPAQKVKVSLPENKTGRPVEYIFKVGDTIIGTATQTHDSAATSMTVVVPPELPDGSVVDVYQHVVGILKDETTGSYTKLEGATSTVKVGTSVASADPPSTDVAAPNIAITSNDDTGKSVWNNPAQNAALTDSEYRQGVDKVTSSLAAINSTLNARLPSAGSGSGGSVTVDLSGVESRLDVVKASLANITDKSESGLFFGLFKYIDLVGDATEGNPGEGVSSGQGSQAATAISEEFPGGNQPAPIALAKVEPSFLLGQGGAGD